MSHAIGYIMKHSTISMFAQYRFREDYLDYLQSPVYRAHMAFLQATDTQVVDVDVSGASQREYPLLRTLVNGS